MIMFNSGIKMMYVSMLDRCNSLVLCYCFRLYIDYIYRVQGTGYRVQGTGRGYKVQGTAGTGYMVQVEGTR